MIWPFRKKVEQPVPPRDLRVWNEDWMVGDTAECTIGPDSPRWNIQTKPWFRPPLGARFIVTGFREGKPEGFNAVCYFLVLEGWPQEITTTVFRKVRPVSTEQSEVVERILNAKPGKDRVRVDV